MSNVLARKIGTDTFKLNMGLHKHVKTHWFKLKSHFHRRNPFQLESVTIITINLAENSFSEIFLTVILNRYLVFTCYI